METRALEQLKTILERQGVKVGSINRQTTPKTLDRVNIYEVGGFMVFCSQKDKIAESDLYKYRDHAKSGGGTSRAIIIAMSKPSENVEKVIKHLIADPEDHLRFFHIRELQVDITQHRLWMPHFLFNDKFKKARPDIAGVFGSYKIEKVEEALGRMDCMDIGARLVGAFPGDVVYIQRHSDTGGYTPYWRRVVEDANVDQ
jgi:DNA-directed RNA polymerase subunit H (RpoH/RPB5)